MNAELYLDELEKISSLAQGLSSAFLGASRTLGQGAKLIKNPAVAEAGRGVLFSRAGRIFKGDGARIAAANAMRWAAKNPYTATAAGVGAVAAPAALAGRWTAPQRRY